METMTSVLTPLGFTTDHVSTLSEVLGWVKQGSKLVRNERYPTSSPARQTVSVRCRYAAACHPSCSIAHAGATASWVCWEWSQFGW
jgi:hypothetical protein